MTATSSSASSLPSSSSTARDGKQRITRGRLKYLFGRPLATHEAPHQAISKKVALAVFASDALSSVAYATQEILIVLAAVGMAAFGISIPIAVAITALLAILTISYRQTIFAYPSGGGAYIVARDNIGEAPAQVAGAALLTDYVLTVAVSISSGVDQIASAFPAVRPIEAPIAVAIILLITYINLRGVKESGAVFALPTYFFIGAIFLTLIVGALRHFTGMAGGLGTVDATTVEMVKRTAEPLGAFLILRAFSSGCTALTGVEAISNGIGAFQDPKSKNAATTLTVMSAILGTMFIGITLLAHQIGAIPSEQETVISQLGHTVFAGLGTLTPILYGALIGGTTLILILAANTSYADFPRLASLISGDGFLPRQLSFRGSRLVFSWGIVLLALAASVLILVFNASTTALIPLYAIGVFMSFTLSQAGMVIRWNKIGKLKPGEKKIVKKSYGETVLEYDANWRLKQVINAVGAFFSFIVMCVFAVTKFRDGAWVTVIIIPTLVVLFFRIHKHYKDVGRMLSLKNQSAVIRRVPMKTIVFIDDVHAGTAAMVRFAMSLGGEWTAVHFDDNPEKTARVMEKWNKRMSGTGHVLELVPAPYRNLMEPAVDYIHDVLDNNPGAMVHIVMGQLIMDNYLAQALHANTTIAFKLALQRMDRVVVTDVQYQLHGEDADDYPVEELTETESEFAN